MKSFCYNVSKTNTANITERRVFIFTFMFG